MGWMLEPFLKNIQIEALKVLCNQADSKTPDIRLKV